MRKYRNTKTRISGIVFDSKLEAEHYRFLLSRLRRGEIKELGRQAKIKLTQNQEKAREQVFYIADFVFFDNDLNEWIVWDSKGVKTQAYVIKRKWLLDCFCGFRFVEVTKKGSAEYFPVGEINLFDKKS